MREDWADQELNEAWLTQMGVYGDLPRRMFVAPIVLSLAHNVVTANNNALVSAMKDGVQKYANLLMPEDSNPEQLRSNLNLSGLNCLDLGCGDGYISKYLSSLCARYLGIDNSVEFISNAKQSANSSYADFKIMDIDQFGSTNTWPMISDMAKGAFNQQGPHLILCHAVIEHLINPEQFLNNLGKLMFHSFPKMIISLIILNQEFFDPFVIEEIPSASSTNKKRTLLVPNTSSHVTVTALSLDRLMEILYLSGLEIIESLQFNKSLYREETWDLLSTEYQIPSHSKIGPFFAFTIRLKSDCM